MSISESYTDRLERELRSITEPLVQQLRDIEGEIDGMVMELAELRAHRTKLVSVIRSIDPELAPKKMVYAKKSKSLVPVSEGKVEEVLVWLRANENGDEFYATGLAGKIPMSQSQVSKVLVILHERGLIHLVRQGTGGSKHYKLVSA